MKHYFDARRIAYIAVMTAVLCVTASISIPIGSVPITLQTFFIALTGIVLGSVDGFIAMLLYLAIGAVGVPVFAGWSAGVGVLAGATGGYLWGFPIMAALCGAMRKKNVFSQIALGLVGLAVIDALGVFQLMRFMSLTDISIGLA